MNLILNMLEWTQRTFEPMGSIGLFILAFMESSFFPIPPDLFLIAFSIAEPSYALYFAFICSLGSVMGGVFGYGIGMVGKKAILEKFFSAKKIIKVHKLYSKYGFWAVFIGGFTPIPYKLFTISAGAFFINFKKFILASTIGRSLRFFSEAILIMLYGETMLDFIRNNFNIATIIFVSVLLIILFVHKKYKKSQL